MIRTTFLMLCIALSGSCYLQGQAHYFVYLTDKPETAFDPIEYFDAKSLARRARMGLPAFDESDLPVHGPYVNAISQRVDSVRYALRWLNAVTVLATEEQVVGLYALPFVKEVESFGLEMCVAEQRDRTPLGRNVIDISPYQTQQYGGPLRASKPEGVGGDRKSIFTPHPPSRGAPISLIQGESDKPRAYTIDASFDKTLKEPEKKLDTLVWLQRRQLEMPLLEEKGITGKGVRIAIFDVGFKEADTHPAFDHIRKRKGIFAVKDFYGGKEDVYFHDYHGTTVLSCIAGMYKNEQIGCAKDAEFLLARTEHKLFEKAIEEDHWIAAAEWADKNGADIINSSLGYTKKRYTYADMNGEATPISKAATLIAEKGILIVSSMGNDGDNKWTYMGAPSDNEEVLSIGGTTPFAKAHIKFSSFGPNASGVLKPNVSAPGLVLAFRKKGGYGSTAGTSFSSPLVAGFAACAMQLHPEKNAKEIFKLIEKTGHYFPYYDYALGYGVPQASRLFLSENPDSTLEVDPTFETSFRNDSVFVTFNPQSVTKDTTTDYNYRVIYYHFEQDGRVNASAYQIVPDEAKQYIFRWRPKAKGILRIWFEGYLFEKKNA